MAGRVGDHGGLISELRRAGGEHVREGVPDPIDLPWLRSFVEREERILRLQYPDGEFPDHVEAELAPLAMATMAQALRRLIVVKHQWRVWSQRLQRRGASADVAEAARKILRREPVTVELLGRRLEITSRSYSAMAEIAFHDLTIQKLRGDLERVEELLQEIAGRARGTRPWSLRLRGHLRRRFDRLTELYQRIYSEMERHRAAIYAHALTPSGAPARSIDEAPEWWAETGPMEDAALIRALIEAGPGRYADLGPVPEPRKRSRVEMREHFGFASLFATWEPELNLEPAELFDRDLVQFLTHLRAGAYDFSDPGG